MAARAGCRRISLPTMSDVARAAGVSVMTVSNVINDRPKVGKETRRRVLDVIDELGYTVNLTARELRAGRSDTVALIIPNFDHYYSELATACADTLAGKGLHLVVTRTRASKEDELSALSQAQFQRYDGIVLSPVGLSYKEIAALPKTQPVLLLGEQELPPG
ncbi:MAG: LacI family transcriptional regulator, partial [Propionibacteriaceae bacterium]|nr:LacI family transcriptional regulator [Propionibacteriaceae bacterium]